MCGLGLMLVYNVVVKMYQTKPDTICDIVLCFRVLYQVYLGMHSQVDETKGKPEAYDVESITAVCILILVFKCK